MLNGFKRSDNVKAIVRERQCFSIAAHIFQTVIFKHGGGVFDRRRVNIYAANRLCPPKTHQVAAVAFAAGDV